MNSDYLKSKGWKLVRKIEGYSPTLGHKHGPPGRQRKLRLRFSISNLKP